MRKLLLPTLLLLLLPLASVHAAWPSTGSYTAWGIRYETVSQASKIFAVNSWYFVDLVDMPVSFWLNVQEDGDDIRTTEDDGETAVEHKLFFIDVANQQGLLAIAQPHGTSGDTVDVTSYIYADNPAASSASSTSVFPSTLEGLWMLQEEPTSAAAILDYTGNGRNSDTIGGTMTSGDLLARTDGPHSYLKCIDFDSNDYIRIPSTLFDDCETAGAYTFFAWVRPGNAVDDYGIFGSAGSQFSARFATGGSWYTLEALQRNSANSAFFTSTGTADNMAATTWHMIHAVYNGSTLKTYVNGVQTGSVTATSLRSATLNFYMGFDNTTYFRGRQAEVGMYSTALSADQCKTMYTNDTDSGFWVITEDAGAPSAPGKASRGFLIN